jgi:hypothetical protein|tara:strand:- start:23 stop:214 length:192 start_codon:yes stop_codon:yes gene_type:complete
MKYKLYKVVALMEMGEEPPVIFDFNLPGVDENSVGQTLSKMESIRKVISVEETDEEVPMEYKG